MSDPETTLYRLKSGMRHYVRDEAGELHLLENCEMLALTAEQFGNYGDKFELVAPSSADVLVTQKRSPAVVLAKRVLDFESMKGKDLVALIRKLDNADLLAQIVAFENKHEKRKGVLKAAGIRARKLAR